MSSRLSDATERIPAQPAAPGPATIVLAALVGIMGAVAVVVLHSAVAGVIGVVAMASGLAATLWSALRLAGDSHASE